MRSGRLWGCVLDDAGRVRCWGRSLGGNLGYGLALHEVGSPTGIGHHGSPAEAYAAMGNGGIVDLGDLDGNGEIDRVVQLALGYAHACARMADGSLRCWGDGEQGQLGYGNTDRVGDDETPAEYYAAHDCGPVPVFAGEGC